MKPINNLLEKTFGRITVLSRAANPGTRKNDTAAYWNCLCTCGKKTIIRGYSLTSGKTQSCGCLKLEAPHLPFLIQSQPKYTAENVAMREAWRSRYLDLPFDIFCRLSQLPCHYCNCDAVLSKKCIRKNDSFIFKYNTLDRIDSSKRHIIGNVVPACLICNRAKLDRTIENFYKYVGDLINNLDRISPEEYREYCCPQSYILPNIHYAQKTSVNARYDDYNDGILSLKQFYQLATSNCYYCRMVPSNKRKIYCKKSSIEAKENCTFIYNGLDRVDNNLPHNYDNVVPCCKYCNTAKSQLSLKDFNNWIIRLAEYKRA